MNVGEVRVADDSDFSKFRNLCTLHEGWTLAYNKRKIRVWTKKTPVCDFKMIKVTTTFSDVSADIVYDVIHDPDYRKAWDTHMISGEEICYINPNNDIGYYSARSPTPLRNRDFVTQRSWLENNGEYLIMNHSVNHAAAPLYKKFIRGISHVTGYYILNQGDNCCEITYLTQCDLRGKIPSWAVNRAAHRVAPSIVTRLHKVSKNYPAWKAKNHPNYKPWINPEQISIPHINWDDVRSMDEVLTVEVIDESACEDKNCDAGSDADSSDKASMNGE